MAKFNPKVGERAVTKKGEGEVVLKEQGWISVQLESGEIIKARAANLAPPGQRPKERGEKTPQPPKGTKSNGNGKGDIFPEGARSSYQRYKPESGGKSRIDCGDEFAVALRDISVDDFIRLAGKLIPGETGKGLADRYAHLNNGQKRMTIGVRLRKTEGVTPHLIKKTRKEMNI